MSDITTWSQTAGSNTGAAPDFLSEGCAPSTVNDAFREMQGSLRRWYDGATVTSTVRPMFVARRITSNQSMPASTVTDCIFNTEDVDQGANYDPATGIFTASTAGVYRFDAVITLTPGGTSCALTSIHFSVNNATAAGASRFELAIGTRGALYSNTGNPVTFGGSVTLKLAAADTMRIKWTAGTSGVNTNALASDASYFTGVKLA